MVVLQPATMAAANQAPKALSFCFVLIRTLISNNDHTQCQDDAYISHGKEIRNWSTYQTINCIALRLFVLLNVRLGTLSTAAAAAASNLKPPWLPTEEIVPSHARPTTTTSPCAARLN